MCAKSRAARTPDVAPQRGGFHSIKWAVAFASWAYAISQFVSTGSWGFPVLNNRGVCVLTARWDGEASLSSRLGAASPFLDCQVWGYKFLKGHVKPRQTLSLPIFGYVIYEQPLTKRTPLSFRLLRTAFAKASGPSRRKTERSPSWGFTPKTTKNWLDPVMLFILTGVWVLRTPNAGQNILFCLFCAVKLKKEEKAIKLVQNLAKNKLFPE